jgi:hypothetical protein
MKIMLKNGKLYLSQASHKLYFVWSWKKREGREKEERRKREVKVFREASARSSSSAKSRSN